MIGINITEDTIEVLLIAEHDKVRIITVEELNSLRDSINEIHKGNGELSLSEEEQPTAMEDGEYCWYASCAMNKINEAYKDGSILENGMVVWY